MLNDDVDLVDPSARQKSFQEQKQRRKKAKTQGSNMNLDDKEFEERLNQHVDDLEFDFQKNRSQKRTNYLLKKGVTQAFIDSSPHEEHLQEEGIAEADI